MPFLTALSNPRSINLSISLFHVRAPQPRESDMHLSGLPVSSRVTISSEEAQLERALTQILGKKRAQFFYTDFIQGASISGRIFFCEKPHGEEFSNLMDYDHGEGIARQLAGSLIQSAVEFPDEMRVPPAPYTNAVRAWEIRTASIRWAPVAIAWATWL